MTAQRCDKCGRMLEGVRPLAVFVDGALRFQILLCRGCTTEALDELLAEHIAHA